jgi:hypothetical protein
MSAKKKTEDTIDKVVGCAALLALWPVIIVWGSIVEAALWRWFVVVAFPAAPHLTAPMFAGLSAFIAAFRGYRHDPSTDGKTMIESAGQSFGRGVAFPAIALLTGWVIKAVWL